MIDIFNDEKEQNKDKVLGATKSRVWRDCFNALTLIHQNMQAALTKQLGVELTQLLKFCQKEGAKALKLGLEYVFLIFTPWMWVTLNKNLHWKKSYVGWLLTAQAY